MSEPPPTEKLYDAHGTLLREEPYYFRNLFKPGQEMIIESTPMTVISCKRIGNVVETRVHLHRPMPKAPATGTSEHCKKCMGDGWLSCEEDECPECLGTGRPQTKLWVAELLLQRRKIDLQNANARRRAALRDVRQALEHLAKVKSGGPKDA